MDFPKLYKSTIMNYQLLAFVIFGVIAILGFLDFLIYTVKKAPKNATLTFRFWILSMVCGMIAIYYVLNGQKFF